MLKAVFIFYHFDIKDRFQVSFINTKIGNIGPNLLILRIWIKINGNIDNLTKIDEAIKTAHQGNPTKLFVYIIRSFIATIAGSMG